LAPAFEAFDVFAFGVCACADIEPAKTVNAKATMKSDFITSPEIGSNRDQQLGERQFNLSIQFRSRGISAQAAAAAVGNRT
jgi:hypothetical protein